MDYLTVKFKTHGKYWLAPAPT